MKAVTVKPRGPISGSGEAIADLLTGTPTTEEEPKGVTIPAGTRTYISTQGDWWDLIALKVYGMRRGDDHLMHKLIEANYLLREICHFPAGVVVMIPEQPVRTEIPLVPWKRASVKTS